MNHMQGFEFWKSKITESIKTAYVEKPEEADYKELYNAAAETLRGILAEKYASSAAKHSSRGEKRVYYMSMEFLMGRSLRNNLHNLGMTEDFEKAVASFGADPEKVYAQEPDAGLGNGGLGRLAACFLDGLATIEKPAMGYSICYEYGIFRQKLTEGWQTEKPDDWLPGGKAWLAEKREHAVEVRFGGEIEESWHDGYHQILHKNYDSVLAVPYDMYVPGYESADVSRLRLWQAESSGIDMELFNRGLYAEAMRKTSEAKAISSILYPNDNHPDGKKLRLKQQYFLVCSSIADIVRRHLAAYGTLENIADKAAIHINDTHPTMCIPELMRILLDECGYSWEKSAEICFNLFSYTNHTVLPEALERWEVGMFRFMLPRIFVIIAEFDRRLRIELREKGFDDDSIRRMAIVENGEIRMANLCVYATHSTNGVSEHHLTVMENSVFADLYHAFPERFSSVTNGIAARRWLCAANPQLTNFVKKYSTEDFEKNYEDMYLIEKHLKKKTPLKEFGKVKLARKELFAKENRDVMGNPLDPTSLFDVQAKRLHEYKRQHLNALRIISLLNEIEANPNADIDPKTFIFGAKAAPGYYVAKRIIRLIWCIGKELSESRAKDILKLCFLENYSVTTSELLMPAADISEQISLAGTEASGTGNMKLMLNGAVTLGTLDGANVEILREVGEKNFLQFGMTSDEVDALRAKGYDPMEYIEKNDELKAALDRMRHGIAGEDFSDLADLIEGKDFYMAAADYQSYMDIQRKAQELFRDKETWNRMAIMNVAKSPVFFVDRTVQEYCDNIWNM
ncbi:MAG: glycogen/starch/alpha-glucan family phosphorylase [Oscillospiraceae bacterium]|nr:glycogen/starch/alpha-glucan family phosphorylase [Oscillospiraceae bacterium]